MLILLYVNYFLQKIRDDDGSLDWNRDGFLPTHLFYRPLLEEMVHDDAFSLKPFSYENLVCVSMLHHDVASDTFLSLS